MNEVLSAESIKKRTAPFLGKGFSFSYFYEKGGDSSCVYICRFQKGKDFFDWREESGAQEIHLVLKVDGQFVFPNLYTRHKKTARAFFWKHLFHRATMEEKRDLFAQMLLKELANNPNDFFGIQL